MNHYELLYIIPAKFTDEEVKTIAQNVQGIVQARGGQIVNEDHGLGRRRLAYPIGQVHQGYYVLLNFDTLKENIPAIDKEMHLAENVVRYQIVRVGKFSDLKSLARQEKERKEAEAKETPTRGAKETKKVLRSEEKVIIEKPVEISEAGAGEVIPTEAKVVEEVKPAEIEEKRPAKRPIKKSAAADLAELDKKLDEILGGDF